jgi:hypothetical protein
LKPDKLTEIFKIIDISLLNDKTQEFTLFPLDARLIRKNLLYPRE